MSRPVKLRIENLHKLFGARAEEARKRLAAGASKDEVYRETGSVVAVADVSFEVKQGEVFVVMGLSGSGKSTLIRCINRLIEPTSGQVTIDDEEIQAIDLKRLRRIRRTKMAMVFQHFALFPHMTVGENVEYGLKIQGMSKKERRGKALDALDQVGLRDWADSAPHNLSGGMQQRVGLARGLAADPEILLMDEPFSALDPLIRGDMQKELLELQARVHKTIVFITHDLHEALILGDQIAIMKDGRFVQVGSPQEIVASPADPYVAAFTKEVDRSRVFTLDSVMKEASALTLERDSIETARSRLDEAETGALYVRDADQKPVGLILAEDLDGAEDRTLADLMRRDFPQGKTGQLLIESYRLCTSGLPVAVVDGEGRLRGVVDPLAVFGELTPGEEAERS